MSNSLAVATVTAVILDIVRQAVRPLEHMSGPIEMRVGRPPSDQPPWVGVNVFLFRTLPNAFRRNDDLPTRSSDGALVRSPQVAIDLEYLISFYGDDLRFEPQRLLAAAMVGLTANPILTPERIRETVATAGPNSPLWSSNLDGQLDSVRLNPLDMNLEVLSRMWSCFNSPFALTIGLVASPVVLDAEVPGRRPLPVTSVGSTVSPGGVFTVSGIEPPVLAYQSGAPVTILSSDKRANVRALFNGVPVAARPVGNGYEATIPPDAFAGLNSVRLASSGGGGPTILSPPVHMIVAPSFGADPVFDRVVDPRIPRDTRGGRPAPTISTISVTLVPELSASREITLALNPVASNAGGRSYAFPQPLVRQMPRSVAAALDGGSVDKSVRGAFAAIGFTLSKSASIDVVQPQKRWVVNDTNAWYRLIDDGSSIVVKFGMSMNCRSATLAFDVGSIAPGTYLIGVTCGDDARASTPLVQGADGAFQGPLITIAEEPNHAQ
jgi:hypothetical protein